MTTTTKMPADLERLKKICDDLEEVDMRRAALIKTRDEQFARVSAKSIYSHSTVIGIMKISRSRHTQMLSKVRRAAERKAEVAS